MYRYALFLLLLIIPFVSCKSLSRTESSDSMTMIPRTTGDITSWKINEGRLNIQSEDRIQISFDLDSSESLDLLSTAETYRYSALKRPDNLIKTMTLYRNKEEIGHIFQGLREGLVLNGLELVVDEESSSSVLLQSSDEEWIVPADTEMNINWGEGEYTAYVSMIAKGEMADHPPFRCNLILLKK
jgi:hypothetical protein